MNDLRYALRQLVKRPGFALAVALVLGVGLGATATIFTVVSALFLREPPHVSEPDRLLRVTRTQEDVFAGSMSYPDYVFLRDNNRTIAGLAAYPGGVMSVVGRAGDQRIPLTVGAVSGNYFDVLGVRPAAGRMLRADEDRLPGAVPVAVVGYDTWVTHLGGRADAVGGTLNLNGHPYTVVGVAPEGFYGPSAAEATPDVWIPLTTLALLPPMGEAMFRREPNAVDYWLTVIGRLAPGVELEAARADLSGLADRMATEFAAWNAGVGVRVTAGAEYDPSLRQRLSRLLVLLAGVAGAVLLVACTNAALLLLARAAARRKELGVRLAMGAARWRVIRHLLIEGAVLASLAAGAGLLVAEWTAGLAAVLIPGSFNVSFRPDLTVVAVLVAVAAGTVLLFALAPAVAASRPTALEELRGTAGAHDRSILRSGLVITQVAVSLALVTGAGLFVRSFAAARAEPLGFDPDRKLVVPVDLSPLDDELETRMAFLHDALAAVGAVPGVRDAAVSRMVPFRGVSTTEVHTADGAGPSGGGAVEAGVNLVSPGYFDVMGIPILRGRDLAATDDADAPALVAVINESLARRLWGVGGTDPVGRTFQRGGQSVNVVGVARDATYYQLGEDPFPQVYFSTVQAYRSGISFLVRTAVDPLAVAGAVRRALLALEPDLVIGNVRPLEDVVAAERAQYRVTATLVSILGGMALLLAVVGLYGVLSFLVAERTRELGVRMALGASAHDVVGLVLRGGFRLVVAGMVIGAFGAWAAGRLVAEFLYDITPRDPISFAAAGVILLGIAGVAAAIPARRAARIDPMEALRHE